LIKVRKRFLSIFLIIITLLLAASAAWIGWRLSNGLPILPDFSQAASQEVWNAEIPKTAVARQAFEDGWKSLEKDPTLTFEKAKAYVFAGGARFESNTPILKVGTETLYGKDLNYYMFLYHYNDYISHEPLTDAKIDPGIDILISNSLILQKAEELGLVKLDSTVFNSVNKDYTKRNELVTKYTPEVDKYFVETISGEVIFVWFNNNTVPVSLEEGKAVAKKKIDELYTKLESGQITMEQAAQMIIDDPEIEAKADPDADGNAYLSFTTQKGYYPPLFWSPEMTESLWALGNGQLSKVVLAKGIDGTERFYAIIKVKERTRAAYQTTDDFVDKEPNKLIDSGEVQKTLQKGD
jgi:hypothetical protein